MNEQAVFEAAVRDLVRSRTPLAPDEGRRLDDLRLGPGGLGLDSIAMVELLLDCGERFGVPAPIELLREAPLTVGRLVTHLRAVVER